MAAGDFHKQTQPSYRPMRAMGEERSAEPDEARNGWKPKRSVGKSRNPKGIQCEQKPEPRRGQWWNPKGIHRKQKPDGACGMVKPEAVSRQRSEPFSVVREAKRAARNLISVIATSTLQSNSYSASGRGAVSMRDTGRSGVFPRKKGANSFPLYPF